MNKNTLQSIQNALIAINAYTFQELCDSFLIHQNENYRMFSRTRSQEGKQKTTTGTPDSFLLLPNGKYLFIEYSTNISKGLVKLKEDIEKCIDTDKTGVPLNEIEEIIICTNFNLDTKETQSLKELLKKDSDQINHIYIGFFGNGKAKTLCFAGCVCPV